MAIDLVDKLEYLVQPGVRENFRKGANSKLVNGERVRKRPSLRTAVFFHWMKKQRKHVLLSIFLVHENRLLASLALYEKV